MNGAKHRDQMSNHQLLQRGSPPVTSYVIITTVFRDAALCSAVEPTIVSVEPAASIFKVPDYTASYPVEEQLHSHPC